RTRTSRASAVGSRSCVALNRPAGIQFHPLVDPRLNAEASLYEGAPRLPPLCIGVRELVLECGLQGCGQARRVARVCKEGVHPTDLEEALESAGNDPASHAERFSDHQTKAFVSRWDNHDVRGLVERARIGLPAPERRDDPTLPSHVLQLSQLRALSYHPEFRPPARPLL